MSSSKQNSNDNSKVEIKIDLNENSMPNLPSLDSGDFGRRGGEKSTNNASNQEYISKPKISSEDTHNDTKK